MMVVDFYLIGNYNQRVRAEIFGAGTHPKLSVAKDFVMKMLRALALVPLLFACLCSVLLGCGGGGGGGGASAPGGTPTTQAQIQAKGGTASYTVSGDNITRHFTETFNAGGSGTWSMTGTNGSTTPATNESASGTLNWSYTIGSTTNPQTGTLVTSGSTMDPSSSTTMDPSAMDASSSITWNNNLTGGNSSSSKNGSETFMFSANR